MYQCTHLPITVRDEKSALAKGRAFLEKWEAESPKSAKDEAFMWVKCFGGRKQLFLDWLGPHLEKKKDKVNRYRLLPCVKELLEKTKDEATPMDEPDKWGLVGITSDGRSFWVIIGLKPSGEYFLNTCYRKY
jgi:hypothetical protein